MTNTKTVGGLVKNSDYDESTSDPLSSLKHESISRMKTALLAVSLDDPYSAAAAMQQVTMLRIYHQVTRIIQYLDLMDKLEDRLYESIQEELEYPTATDNVTVLTRLLGIQEKLQKSIIESNKLLAPYLEMDQYTAFASVEAPTPISAQVLDISSNERNALRENAGAIINELKSLAPESVE